MISVNDIKNGMTVEDEGGIFQVLDFQHVKPGKGAAFVKVRARSQKTGNSREYNYKSGDRLEDVQIFEKEATYSYKQGDEYVFMDSETFEQYNVPAELCEDIEHFVLEGGECTIYIYEDAVLSVAAPNFVTLKVIEANPGLKGDTATKATKPVKLETGYEINVPLFIEEGNVLKIDTRTGDYLERVKG